MKKVMRQIGGAFAEREKGRLVGSACERKREEQRKCKGRKSRAERSAKQSKPAKAFAA